MRAMITLLTVLLVGQTMLYTTTLYELNQWKENCFRYGFAQTVVDNDGNVIDYKFTPSSVATQYAAASEELQKWKEQSHEYGYASIKADKDGNIVDYQLIPEAKLKPVDSDTRKSDDMLTQLNPR